MLAGEFVDYERSPAFWFLFALIIGAEVSEDPSISAKYNPLEFKDGDHMAQVIEDGLKTYEKRNYYRFKY